MVLSRDLVDEVRRLDEAGLKQLLILARGLLLDSETPVLEIDDIPGMPAVRYRQRRVRCGKATCRSCPHGPYWYAHWTEGGRRRSRYVGAELPGEVRRKLEALDAGQAVAQGVDEPPRRAAVAGGARDEGPRLRVVRD